MPSRTAVVASAVGLHARPASVFAQTAAALDVPVTVLAHGRSVSAASILGVLSLGIDHGETVELVADGPGADDALDTLRHLLETDLDAR